jgi:hypothetical protein
MPADTAMAKQHAPAGLRTADLNVAEQFVLWALRTRLEGAAKRDRLGEGFRLARDDAAGGVALEAFEPWFDVLATYCWRNLYLHRAPCSCVSGDEWAMLDLVASAQAGDETRLCRVAAVLVHPQAVGFLQDASRTFAAALCRLGLHLSGDRMPRARGASALLH